MKTFAQFSIDFPSSGLDFSILSKIFESAEEHNLTSKITGMFGCTEIFIEVSGEEEEIIWYIESFGSDPDSADWL